MNEVLTPLSRLHKGFRWRKSGPLAAAGGVRAAERDVVPAACLQTRAGEPLPINSTLTTLDGERPPPPQEQRWVWTARANGSRQRMFNFVSLCRSRMNHVCSDVFVVCTHVAVCLATTTPHDCNVFHMRIAVDSFQENLFLYISADANTLNVGKQGTVFSLFEQCIEHRFSDLCCPLSKVLCFQQEVPENQLQSSTVIFGISTYPKRWHNLKTTRTLIWSRSGTRTTLHGRATRHCQLPICRYFCHIIRH